jgi:hypothetical protein
MDDGLAYLALIIVILIVIVYVVGFLLSIGIFILGAIAGAGVVSGLTVGIQNFSEVLAEAHRKLPTKEVVYIEEFIKQYYEPQPAYLTYAFAGGWQVMKHVRENAFSRTASHANWWYDQGKKAKTKAEYESNSLVKYYLWSAYAGCQLAGMAQYLAAMLIVAIFFAVQFVVLLAWMLISILLMVALATINLLYGSYYKIFFRCPDCHEQMSIPIYVCPKCATEHTRLWPSVYGVFYHRCANCNNDLPTLDIFGRTELVQKCAECSRPMNKEIGRLINIHIPVIGGPSVGKSNYIFMATRELIEKYLTPRGYTVNFPDEKHLQDYQENVKRLSSGIALRKTPDVVPQAYNLAIKRSHERLGRIIYIYDAAGEAYSSESNAYQQIYFRYVHGLIFMIDPFSIEIFARQHENEISKVQNGVRPSQLSATEAYERMITVLESNVGLKRGERFKHPIAVVVTKTDALGLEHQIGQLAAKELMRKDSSIRLVTDAMNVLVQQFLVDNQLGNFVRDIQLQFENVFFFSCSALGRSPDPQDHRAYVPIGVLDPLLWLLGETGVVRLIQERSQTIDLEHRRMASSLTDIFEKAKYYFWDSLNPRSK